MAPLARAKQTQEQSSLPPQTVTTCLAGVSACILHLPFPAKEGWHIVDETQPAGNGRKLQNLSFWNKPPQAALGASHWYGWAGFV